MRIVSFVLLVALAGCVRDTTSYPSLAPRAVEQAGFAEPEAPAPQPIVGDPALDAQIVTARTALTQAKTAFDAAAAKAARSARAARGAAAGSEGWIAAQSDLADLDALRADGGETVMMLEQLAIDRAAQLKAEYPALTAAISDAHAATAAQTATIGTLQASLKR